jgi:hypothetical protein
MPSVYQEPELSTGVDLCDERGRLNPAALGWSRLPLVRANLTGRWPRKKRWNFWNWISPRFSFAAVVADIDLGSFCRFFFVDFETGGRVENTDLRRSGYAHLSEHVDRTLEWSSPRADFVVANEGARLEVGFRGRGGKGESLRADFAVHRPPGHESLNVVVPWSDRHFQLNSKHNTLPCEGAIEVDGRRYELRPDDCHAVQDWGRGIWPYRSCWNWAVCTGEVGGELVGVNLGDRWTTGTGANENGICYRGRLYKIMEDVQWRYDRRNWYEPWRIRAPETGMVDLSFHPFYVHVSNLELGLLASGGAHAFGRWRGWVRCGDAEIEIPDLVGWAEEFVHRW